MADGPGSDLVGHFQAALDALKRHPVLIVPPLGAQLIMFVLMVALFGGVAGVTLLGGIAQGLAGLLAGGALLMLLGSLLSLVASGAVIVMAREALASREPVLGDAVSAVLARFVDVLIASVLLTVIVGIGTLLFVLPGLVAAFFLVFTLPAVLLDDQGAVAALRRSATLVRANIGPVVGLVIGGILAAVVGLLVSKMLGLVPLLGPLAAAIVNGALISYLTVVGVRIYRALPRP